MRSGSGTGSATRRVATVIAAVGALLISSGIALMVAPTTATAARVQHQPVSVCHATSSDTNPYVFIVVDNDSVKLRGHLAHKTSPNKVWKSTITWNGTTYDDGDAKRDFIGSYTDEEGTFHAEDGTLVTEEWCTAGAEEAAATADVEFADPTCDNGNVGTFETIGDHVTFDVTESTPASEAGYEPGSEILVVATADSGYQFEDGTTQATFPWTFGPAEEGCGVVEPPVVPEEPTFVDPTCTTSPAVDLPDVDTVEYAVVGEVAPGETVQVTATAVPPAELGEGSVTEWTHTFTVPTGCTIVSPPTPGGEDTVTPTVVEAGLAGDAAAADSGDRDQQGLALVLAGLVLMAGAGALGRATRVRSRDA